MALSTASTRRTSGTVLRSHSPSTTYFASTTSAFRSTSFFHNKITTPVPQTPTNGYTTSPPSSSVRFSLLHNRPISPNRSIHNTTTNNNNKVVNKQLETTKKTCMCSPTSHPGSFRCKLHKNSSSNNNNNKSSNNSMVTYPSNRLNARRSAMTNSLVRIGTVEGGDLVKRALAALIRPSSHQQRRRTSFQPRPSRLSVMSKAQDM